MEYSNEATFALWDEDREFLTVPVVVSMTEVILNMRVNTPVRSQQF